MEMANGIHQTPVMVTEQPLLDQVLEQSKYDARVIDKVLMRGDLKDVEASERLEFYRAVCLSVGLSPLTQPFILMERQDKSLWIYATASACQQLAKVHRVSFRDMKRMVETVLGEPMCRTEVVAYTPDGRCVPAQGVVSLTKKKREQKGQWPNGDPKYRDALDADGEPVLIPLRGDALANALKKADTQALRRATLALLGLGWVQTEDGGRPVQLNMQTGELLEEVVRETVQRPLTQRPAEQGKTGADHASDLYGDQAGMQAALAAVRQTVKDAGVLEEEIDAIAQAREARESIRWAEDPVGAARLEERESMMSHINAMHVAHGYALHWIASFWGKMERQYGVTPGRLTNAQIAECESKVATYYARLDTQEGTQKPQEGTQREEAVPEVSPEVLDATSEQPEAFRPHPPTWAWKTLCAHYGNAAVPEALRAEALELLKREESAVSEGQAFAMATAITDAMATAITEALEERGREPEAQGKLV